MKGWGFGGRQRNGDKVRSEKVKCEMGDCERNGDCVSCKLSIDSTITIHVTQSRVNSKCKHNYCNGNKIYLQQRGYEVIGHG